MKKYGKLAAGILVLALLLGGSAALYRSLAEKYRPNALKEVDKEEGREEGSEGEGGAGITGGQDAGSVTDGEKDGGTADGEQDSGEKGGAADESMKAPDFTVRNAAEEEVKLSDFAGKPVILNFWASWCGPCKSEMPAIQAAWEQSGQDIDFVIVNMTGMSGETEQSAKTFLADEGYSFPAYFDTNNSAAAAFGVSSIPQTYLINADGDIIGAYMGAMDDSVINQGIAMLKGEADVAQ